MDGSDTQEIMSVDTEKITNNVSSGKRDDELLYAVDDKPPWLFSFFLGFQHNLILISRALATPFILSTVMCFEKSPRIKGEVLQTILFTNGLNTLLQVTFGVRLPIVQGSSFAVIVPVMTFMKYRSLAIPCDTPNTLFNITSNNITSEYDNDAEYLVRFRMLQGCFMLGSLFQLSFGFFGVIGILVKFIGPLTIAPTITMITLPLFGTAAHFSEQQWTVAFFVSFLVILFSQVLKNVKVPLYCATIELFKVFPVLLSIILGWLLCTILTFCGALPEGSTARVDHYAKVLQETPWFRVPYPGQWGTPTLNTAGMLGILTGLLASMIESVGDYYACARLAGAPKPPIHALNRGIGCEGIGVFLTGLWGTGSGCTSHSANIAAIGITRVGSLRILQCSALILLVLSVFGKLSAFFTTIPDPVVGGVFIVTFGMVAAVGLSMVKHVDMSSTRNILVLGLALFNGFLIPEWIKKKGDRIDVGNSTANEVFRLLLSSNMFVAGFTGCVLDNLLPGTRKERGFLDEGDEDESSGKSRYVASVRHYDPPFLPERFFRHKICKYLPFMPYYGEEDIPLKWKDDTPSEDV